MEIGLYKYYQGHKIKKSEELYLHLMYHPLYEPKCKIAQGWGFIISGSCRRSIFLFRPQMTLIPSHSAWYYHCGSGNIWVMGLVITYFIVISILSNKNKKSEKWTFCTMRCWGMTLWYSFTRYQTMYPMGHWDLCGGCYQEISALLSLVLMLDSVQMMKKSDLEKWTFDGYEHGVLNWDVWGLASIFLWN